MIDLGGLKPSFLGAPESFIKVVGSVENDNIMRYKFTLLVVLACICSVWAEAKVKLPSVLSDGMVLQRESPIKIWGTAEPGEDVVVTLRRRNTRQRLMRMADGWSCFLL